MTVMEFFGCSFIAFGPALALFIFTIANDPLRIIVLMASAFFWLLSLLISSLLWFAVVPLRSSLAFGLVFSVIFQEVMRFVFYLMLRKANEGLARMSDATAGQGTTSTTLVHNKHLMAYVSGLGFGIISGAFALINVLADMVGPGTVGIHGDSQLFFITSALLTLAIVLLHTFWGVIFYAGLDTRKYLMPLTVLANHMLISCLTLLNSGSTPLYLASLIPAYLSVLLTGVWAFVTVGGSAKSLQAFCRNQAAGGYDIDVRS